MKPRIAIPVPNSQKSEYSERTLPQYQHAIRDAGGEPVVVPLEAKPEQIAKIITECDGVLLPGSAADVEPQKYGALREDKTNPADPLRDAADELLLQDAYNLRKPVFGICYGMQSLNVWRSGTLVQDLPSRLFAPPHSASSEGSSSAPRFAAAAQKSSPVQALQQSDPARAQSEVRAAGQSLTGSNDGPKRESGAKTGAPGNAMAVSAGSPPPAVNHAAGGTVQVAHRASIVQTSQLFSILADAVPAASPAARGVVSSVRPSFIPALPVNSSHHQSVDKVGDGLRVSARCAEDGVIEAIEGTLPGHFVLAVQWHPERNYDSDPASRALFRAFIQAARGWSVR